MERISCAWYLAVVLLVISAVNSVAQQGSEPSSIATNSQPSSTRPVPRLVRFSGSIKDVSGKPVTGVAGVTFALYKDQDGGAALWVETQNVRLDGAGHFGVMLGASKTEGLPSEVFASGEARWLGVQPEGQAEQPRVLLLSVPYALKAADAETLGGLPPSAFMRTSRQAGAAASGSPTTDATSTLPTLHGGGTLNFLPLWTSQTTVGNSVLFQSNGRVGIGTTTPTATLDVNGSATIRGNQSVTGTLTTTGQVAAQAGNFTGSNTSQIINVTQSGSGAGISATTVSNSGAAAAIIGSAIATSGSGVGVTGISAGNSGTGVFGLAGQLGVADNAAGIRAVSLSTTGVGVIAAGSVGVAATATSSTGIAGTFNNIAGGQSLSAQISGTEVFGVHPWGTLVNGKGLIIGGNGASMVQGDPGCGWGFAGIGFTSLSGCSNYSLVGDGRSTYLNRPLGGSLFFRENNGTEMTISPGGAVSILSSTPRVTALTAIATTNAFAGAFFGSGSSNGIDGATAVFGQGGSGTGTAGGDGAHFYGGNGSNGYLSYGGTGGWFYGGNSTDATSGGGGGIVAIPGNYNGDPNQCCPVGVFAAPANTGGDDRQYDAGIFTGGVTVWGTLNAGAKNFRIDHPLDPANKYLYLYHSSVESSEMMNIYTGNVVLDANGEGTVQLPDWFEALNGEFRYQLTCLGAFAPVYIAREIEDGSFRIAGGRAGLKISWQVTGIRQDAFARAYPLHVEVAKSVRERGYYIHPDLYGAPQEKGIEWARFPEQMKRIKQHRAESVASARP